MELREYNKDMAEKKQAKKKMPLKRRGESKNLRRKRAEGRSIFVFAGLSVLILILTGVIAANFSVIKDFFSGLSYRPSDEMADIRDKLELTEAGARTFNAVHPELQEKAEFNYNCRETQDESAILGCYKDNQIFVYNVVDSELSGIRELTAAHELLHAVYERMSDGDKNKWGVILKKVYEENEKALKDEIELYPDEQKKEELYVRAGTEIKDLPDELEKHYAEIFDEQDKIVDFYNSYITVFRRIEQRMAELIEKSEKLKDEINKKTADYEARAESLNAAAEEFNNCAATLNCFTSAAAFNNRRAELVAEQTSLKALYDEITRYIAKYNEYVTEYNENAQHGQMLNMTINSSEEIEEVK